eukprot:TRINITY_DN1937_c0_g1_i3.p1 TRINITY_DN1937_c0_g1~~TRINITY_DN1937_c0_g1_i3.p1  ORF type:complete len:190 (+),score=13.03 TRINITY_DN1937_c0_g1_i3:54-623(+)
MWIMYNDTEWRKWVKRESTPPIGCLTPAAICTSLGFHSYGKMKTWRTLEDTEKVSSTSRPRIRKVEHSVFVHPMRTSDTDHIGCYGDDFLTEEEKKTKFSFISRFNRNTTSIGLDCPPQRSLESAGGRMESTKERSYGQIRGVGGKSRFARKTVITASKDSRKENDHSSIRILWYQNVRLTSFMVFFCP